MINIFLFSHSFLDMAFVLGYCAKYDKQRNITILVSGSRENMSFLEEYFPYRANIRFLDFKTKNPNLKLGKIEFIFALFQEKFLLQKLKKEILFDKMNELIFSSLDNDPQAHYLVNNVAKKNNVFFADILNFRHEPISYLPVTMTLIKNILQINLYRIVFGNHYVISGSSKFPLMSLRTKFNFPKLSVNQYLNGNHKIKLIAEKNYILVAHNKLINRSFEYEKDYYQKILGILTSLGFTILVKTHPQYYYPEYLNKFKIVKLNKNIPMELIDLVNCQSIIGVSGATMLINQKVAMISILNIIYSVESEDYDYQYFQLKQNKEIIFPSSYNGQIL